ncbi:BspA family leucine-rich repeat surface protein [Bombilactobacillus mellis]|uniref:BspA family leucine-rich repeat surface protein n=1 Tax=Bombilactobacillus mellis TaxID=1218508 RepID=UPI0022462C78|nr:BspA family leucine-rich repeat surface protein [Bombilactobacillus mellis]MCX0279919.1 BspA family leucine-rich repeat surface protein [Bombilactobacillus mellis]
MYQISKRLTMAGALLGLAYSFLLTQQPTKAANTPQAATPTTQVVKADSNVLDQGVDGTCKWDIVKDGDEKVLTIHAGQLDPGGLAWKINSDFINKVTKLVIDPGVIAPKDSSSLFSNLTNVKEFVDLSNLDTSQVISMTNMFFYCSVKELDLSNWDTSNVTDMLAMFMNCYNLEKINLSSFNTRKVEDFGSMFKADEKLRNLDLSSFKTPNLKRADQMFEHMYLNNIDIRNFDNTQIDNENFLYDTFLGVYGVYKLTVGPNLKNTYFPIFLYKDPVFNVNGHVMIAKDNTWIATSGPEKGVLKTSYEMKSVTRTEPITYTPEMEPIINTSTEYKTVTRTINIHLPYDQGISSIVQKATIHRQVTVNNDRTKTYGEWSKDCWDEFNAPNMDGEYPNPDKVDRQIVDGNTQDQTVDIYYE